MMLEKARWHDPPACEEDLRRVLREFEAAKNRLFNRSGFSPSQRMLGRTPRSNGELMSDDAIDPALLEHILHVWGRFMSVRYLDTRCHYPIKIKPETLWILKLLHDLTILLYHICQGLGCSGPCGIS